jgi:hypothetical protein
MKLVQARGPAEKRHTKPETRSVSATHVVVEGTLKPDGSLELDSKLDLPPGRVQLIVQPLPELPKDDPFWQMMDGIWAAQKARGHVPRTKEEIDAEIRVMREEAEEEMQEVERLQEDFRPAWQRDEKSGGEPPK